MTTKIIVRIISAENTLLGWAETMAHARGDGSLWAQEDVIVPIEAEGDISQITAHWVDVNVVVPLRAPRFWPPLSMAPGSTVTLVRCGEPIIKVGEPAGGLHPVTVRRAISVHVPTGALGAVAGQSLQVQ